MLLKNVTYLDENFNLATTKYLNIENGRFADFSDDAKETADSKATMMSPVADHMEKLEKSANYQSGVNRTTGEFMEGKEQIDCSGLLIMPAFYNSHAHSPMSLMRGYGENMSLNDWLNDKIWPFESHLNSESIYWGTMLSMAESIKNGIVSSTDMYYFTSDMVRAYVDAGVKGNISRALVNFDGIPYGEMDSFREMERAHEQFDGLNDGEIIIEASIHGEYTSDEQTVKGLAEYAKAKNMRMHIHLSETREEHENCITKRKMTPCEYFVHCGLLDAPTTAAHCVWVSDSDIEILKEKKVTVSHNPQSNLKLASGVAPIKKMMDRGVSVAIGTDSVASNNSLNFFEAMKLMGLLAKVSTMDPTVLSPMEILTSATRNGALAQGRDDCGFIKKGFRADFIAVDLKSPSMNPIHEIANNLVYSGDSSLVKMTVCDGEILYKDGEFEKFDIDEVIRNANIETERILKLV